MSFLVPKEVREAAEKVGAVADELALTLKTCRDIAQSVHRILVKIERGVEAMLDEPTEPA